MTSIAAILFCTFLPHLDVALGQDRTYEATVTEDFLYSPGYDVGLNYGNNMTFDYRVYTNYFNHTVLLQVVDCDMETDKNGNCFYDTLTIHDGYNESATELDVFCCSDPTNPPSWTSTQSEVYLKFESDGTNVGRGFKISFVSDGVTSTTSTTSTTTSTTSTTTTSTSTTTTPTITTTTTTPTTTTTTSTTTTTPTTTTTTTTTPTTTPTTTTTTTTSTTTPTPTTPTQPPTTTTAISVTTPVNTASPQSGKSSGGNSNNTTYIIAGVCAGIAFIVIVVLAVICFIIKSKNRPVIPLDSKSAIWRVNVQSRPPTSKASIPPKFPDPPGHVETTLFDMDLPDGRGNLLPPLSSTMDVKKVES